jgi:hypothetical protein
MNTSYSLSKTPPHRPRCCRRQVGIALHGEASLLRPALPGPARPAAAAAAAAAAAVTSCESYEEGEDEDEAAVCIGGAGCGGREGGRERRRR